MGIWAAKARFGVQEIHQIVDTGAVTARQIKELITAQKFLRDLRLAMHLHAKRAQDHLLFEVQEKLAPQMFPEVEIPGAQQARRSAGVQPAVERLMHAFYRHVRTVVLETDGILERCCRFEDGPPSRGTAASSKEGEHLEIVSRQIRSSKPERFWEQPAEILRAFEVALEHNLPLDRKTRDAIAEAVADLPGAQLKVDEEAAAIWMRLLCSTERAGDGTVLEEMHHLGVVSAIIPEFEPCTGRIQHDLYHVFTVDLHSLYVVALLKAWSRGELKDQYHTPVSVIERIKAPQTLFLAALLHDVGKPLGHQHSKKGARLAAGVAARLGLPAEEQQEVTFLVLHHLVMAHLSQRRDLADPAVIDAFAQQVVTTDRLRKLYLLTMADTAMTAPSNLNEWKISLLDDLYLKTYIQLSLGEKESRRQRQIGLRDKRDALELALRREWGGAGAELLRRVPDEALLSFSVTELTHHLGVAMKLELSSGTILQLDSHQRDAVTSDLTICCNDSPGRLAMITGVMLAHRIEVLGAQVYTLDQEEKVAARILDIFTVQATEHTEESLWQDLARDLERALRGELSVPDLVHKHTRPSKLTPKVIPAVEIQVKVDNDVSERFTVIEVVAPDRLGVLYAITKTFSEQGLTIHLSKVASEAGRVIDNFYVSDSCSGGKVTDEPSLERICQNVIAAIEELR
jgi:[protein-PII] uridylyltransferase